MARAQANANAIAIAGRPTHAEALGFILCAK
jgi:hypothetical protein